MDKIFLTIDLKDIKDEKINLKNNELQFIGFSNNKKYKANIKFFSEIDENNGKYEILGQSLKYVLIKKKEKYWDRLTSKNCHFKNISIDFDQ